MTNISILLVLAEQEKEHGYSVLAAEKDEQQKISPCPFAVERSTATLFWHYLLYKQRLCFGEKK